MADTSSPAPGRPPSATSNPEPSSRPATANGEPTPFSLDLAKLQGLSAEQQGLYLLTFTADLARHAEELDADGIVAEQAAIKKECFQIINLSSPSPSRIIRTNLGKCFREIFTKGNRKALYESINECVAILNANAKEKDIRAKHAAVYCLGVIFETAGDSALSHSPDAATSVLKALKGASNETGFRSAIFCALGRVCQGVVAAVDEDIARAIWKQARNAVASDKSPLVQVSACRCLEQLVRSTPYFDDSNAFDKLQAALWKAMESTSTQVRHAAASCLVAELVKNYSETAGDAVPKLRKPKKTKKQPKTEELDNDLERPSSPAPEKPATALAYSLNDILKLLAAQFFKPATNNRVRAGIATCYVKLFRTLGESVVEQRYSEIALHLFGDLLRHPSLQFNKHRQLLTRRFVSIILERVVGGMIGETAQLNACRFLASDILKDYPQTLKERPEPSKTTLTGALSALTSLIKNLDAAVSSIAELCRESLLQVLQHPNFTVQVHTSRALRAFVLACPQQLLPTVTICMNSLNRELNLLAGPRKAPKRCIGYAHGLAAVLSTSSQHPLYGSVDVYARVLQQAVTLLKSSGSSDLRISSCQLQVAWTMIGGLMSLGPNFVKIHLPQLMLLWKNALPRPVGKENMSQRNMIELSYLAHVRECALGSVKSFLMFNQRLLTSDISRRLSLMLENTVTFLQTLPERKASDDPANRLHPTLQLQDYEIMVRRRVFECFTQLLLLSPQSSIEVTAHSSILPLAVASFSDVEYYAPNSLSTTLANAAASFESIWDVSDNYGFGVTGLVRGLDIQNPVTRVPERHWSLGNDVFDQIDQVVLSPVGTAPEYDSTCCYLSTSPADDTVPSHAGTEVVNSAISAFSLSFPLQAARVQESLLEQMGASVSSGLLQKDPARKAAITVNMATALMAVCQVATGDIGSVKGDIRRDSTEKALQALLHACVKDSDATVRLMAANAIGRLCSTSGNTLTSSEVTYLTETIVNNREPHVRAGCALALAQIHSRLGGMAAGFHMKTIVGILMSLAADTHPLVHFWALDSLSEVASSAGLNFSSHVTSFIGMLGQLYVSDTHNAETAILASSNLALEFCSPAVIARGLDSIVNVLGPDLQDMTKARDMIFTFVRLILDEQDVGTRLEGLRCMEHLSLYAPGHVNFARYVKQLQLDLGSESREISNTALQGLSILMRRDASEVVRTAHPGLEDHLWDWLNRDTLQPAVRNIFTNWLLHTGSSNPAEWIQRCNDILVKTKAKIEPPVTAVPKSTGVVELQDEEVAGFAVSAGATKEDDSSLPTSKQELMRWQVRLFAMECLHDLITMISKEAAVSDDSPGEAALQSKVAEIIRIAFSASTAGVAALRVVGMKIIDQILKMFGRTPDPDFPEAMLLEQYQAQISSALTPAFAADSSPELAAAAVSVCATFIATGIVTDVERMGRILKVLVAGLDSFSQSTETASIGDLRALSANAQIMVRMAVFSAWAELQIASSEQSYLKDVVKPHIARLVPLWLSSLREYARLRFEPDISASVGNVGDLDTVYAALNRQTLLKFYQDAWLSLVDAIASLIDEDSELVFAALDSKNTESTEDADQTTSDAVTKMNNGTVGINYREEPVAFFFVLFGLAFESLAVRTSEEDIVVRQRNLDILQALQKILRPSVSGNAIYQEVIFAETMDLLDRMVLTESLSIQAIIVDTARNLCLAHPSSRSGKQAPTSEHLSDDIEQLFELTRIVVLVLAGLIPGLADNPVSARRESSDEVTNLARTALQALVDVSDVFPAIIKTDLHATILHIFVVVLGTGDCQARLVPQALPIYRRFIASIAEDGLSETRNQLRNALTRMLVILKNTQRRETEASVPCEKNTLLAITILLSAAPGVIPDDDPLVVRFISELQDCLETPLTSRVAAGCMRTLLLAGIHARVLLQRSIAILVHASDLEGQAEIRALMSQTLTLFAPRLPADRRPTAFAAFIAALLARASYDGPAAHTDTAARLLDLAALDPLVFRTVVAQLTPASKAALEIVLRARAGANDHRAEQRGLREPTITLKMNF